MSNLSKIDYIGLYRCVAAETARSVKLSITARARPATPWMLGFSTVGDDSRPA
jgi:hypothetical protein